MYNSYIPGPGGGYICQKVVEPQQRPVHPPDPPSPEHASCAEAEPSASQHSGQTRPSLLQRLIPQNLEADDLLILLILVLLMMDSNDDEDSLTILLAAAAYLILR